MFRKMQLGFSSQGRSLDAMAFGAATAPALLLLGAVHGDEIEGVWLLEEACRRWQMAFSRQKVQVVVWPQVNPDGVAAQSRWNGRQVDLNRNLPTKDWSPVAQNPRYQPGPHPGSEPENQVLLHLLEELKPVAILSAHSFHRYQVNANGPSREWAELLSAICGYPVTEDIGYPTPGALGTYAGLERSIPTITLEIERGLTQEKVLKLHLPLLEAAVQYWEAKL